MIKVRRLNNKELAVNSDLILCVESTPDTIISFTNGKKIVVLDTLDEIIDKVIEHKALVNNLSDRYMEREV